MVASPSPRVALKKLIFFAVFIKIPILSIPTIVEVMPPIIKGRVISNPVFKNGNKI